MLLRSDVVYLLVWYSVCIKVIYKPLWGKRRRGRRCLHTPIRSHKAKVGGHGLYGLANSNLEGLVARHLDDLDRTVLVEGGTWSLSWGRGSRGGLVLVRLEERHGCSSIS